MMRVLIESRSKGLPEEFCKMKPSGDSSRWRSNRERNGSISGTVPADLSVFSLPISFRRSPSTSRGRLVGRPRN